MSNAEIINNIPLPEWNKDSYKSWRDWAIACFKAGQKYEQENKLVPSTAMSNNNELKCTPGQWEINNRMPTRLGICVNLEDAIPEESIAALYGNGMDEEVKANAYLIASSKDLYEALREVRKWYEKAGFDKLAPDTPVCFSKALSALQKANPNYKP